MERIKPEDNYAFATFYNAGSDDEDEISAAIEEAYPPAASTEKLTPVDLLPRLKIPNSNFASRQRPSPPGLRPPVSAGPVKPRQKETTLPTSRFAPEVSTDAPSSAGTDRSSPKSYERQCHSSLGFYSEAPVQKEITRQRTASPTKSGIEPLRPKPPVPEKQNEEAAQPPVRKSSPKQLEPKPVKHTAQESLSNLPYGLKPEQAAAHMNKEELERIKKHARRQVEKYEVLEMTDVDALAKVCYCFHPSPE